MNIKTNIALTTLPVLLLVMPQTTYAANCVSPCNIDDFTNPELHLRDTSNFGQDWEIQNIQLGDGDSRLEFGVNGVSNSFVIENAAATNTLVVDDNSRVGIGTAAPAVSLEVIGTDGIRINNNTAGGGKADLVQQNRHFVIRDESATNRFAIETDGNTNPVGHDQLYLDNDGDVGIQTTEPSTDLVVGGLGQILMQNPSAPTRDWGFWTGSTGFWVSRSNNNVQNGTQVLKFQNTALSNSIVVNGTGVGLGTTSPATSLHIKKTNAVLKVEDTNATTAVRTVVQLKNKGALGFSMEDTSQPVTWDFRTSGTGNFIMNDVGDPAEVTVKRNGDMIVAGTVFEGSSRAIKTDIDAINSKEFMDKLSKVEVLEWRYKEADKKDRHIGPISEDFYKLFKLGTDDKHVSPRDIASIALLAAKELQMQSVSLAVENAALKKQLEDKTSALQSSNKNLDAKTAALKVSNEKLDAKTAALKESNDKLQERLASLEKLVTNLASAEGSIDAKTSKVALNMK